MACQAIGRCRICARKHKIAVFGGEEAQHFFIEKANLKLIILNTVCIVCIGKVEKFVEKMDLDMFSIDSVKEEDDLRRGSKSPEQSFFSDTEGKSMRKNDKEMSKIEEFNVEADNISSKPDSMPMEIYDIQSKENPIDAEASTTNCSNRISRYSDVIETPDARAQPTYHGDSQTARNSPHSSALQQIGQDELGRGEEATEEPCRKRPRNSTKIRLAVKLPAENASPLNSTSMISTSSGSKRIVDNCGLSDCSSSVKKGGRSLWCDFCKKEFTHAGDLNKHRRRHTGEKPYNCNQCQRKFAHASNLARHLRVHSGERPFVCTRCGRTFTRRDKLSIHNAAKRCQPNQNESQVSQESRNAEITPS